MLRQFTSRTRSFSVLSSFWKAAEERLATKKEQKLRTLLESKFPKANSIEVTDTSGGCGEMFEVKVVSLDFRGLSLVNQHRLINEALKEEIKSMHGLRIHTSASGK